MREVDPHCRIRTDKYELDNTDDLAGVEESRLKHLSIVGRQGKIRLWFGGTISSVSIEEPDRVTRGMAAELEGLVNRRRTFFVRMRSSVAYLVLLGISVILSLGGVVFLTILDFPAHAPLPIDWRLAVTLGLQLPMILILALVRPPGMIMYTRTRAEQPPWWQRNRDSLITNTAVSFLFLVIGIILGYLLPKS